MVIAVAPATIEPVRIVLIVLDRVSAWDRGDPSHSKQVARVAPGGPAPVRVCVHHA